MCPSFTENCFRCIAVAAHDELVADQQQRTAHRRVTQAHERQRKNDTQQYLRAHETASVSTGFLKREDERGHFASTWHKRPRVRPVPEE